MQLLRRLVLRQPHPPARALERKEDVPFRRPMRQGSPRRMRFLVRPYLEPHARGDGMHAPQAPAVAPHPHAVMRVEARDARERPRVRARDVVGEETLIPRQRLDGPHARALEPPPEVRARDSQRHAVRYARLLHVRAELFEHDSRGGPRAVVRAQPNARVLVRLQEPRHELREQAALGLAVTLFLRPDAPEVSAACLLLLDEPLLRGRADLPARDGLDEARLKKL